MKVQAWQNSAGKVHCNVSVKLGTVYPVISRKGDVAEREV